MTPSSIDDLLAITGGHPLIRSVHPERRGRAWRADGAVAFLHLNPDRATVRRVVGLGTPEAVAGLLAGLRGELPANVYVNVPRGTPLPLADPVDWQWRVAYEAPPRRPGEDLVDWHGDTDAITDLLKRTGPDWSVWPRDGRARRWAAVRGEDGGILACLADTTTSPEVGQVAAIAVRPEARRRALGASITTWAMRRLLAEGHDGVGLGVYAENTAAMRLYDRLGFDDEARTSGRLPA
ncbi:GNAT family N-acetyltransferase [Actinoallomurus rhizosphaericola]|uniref:GNAT family N-acetyltransferase n=1 Tax=Actinoallomurus rhizosphaericola TaxID=2952536 RepID=UPI002092374B|nr:GNAT family N-acetyltransferase [Actinoallomurus rhizosphaericola]MCO5996891.1 GNAT family N-acetyltransferase [Actinoallomurus rhizosphaericola]